MQKLSVSQASGFLFFVLMAAIPPAALAEKTEAQRCLAQVQVWAAENQAPAAEAISIARTACTGTVTSAEDTVACLTNAASWNSSPNGYNVRNVAATACSRGTPSGEVAGRLQAGWDFRFDLTDNDRRRQWAARHSQLMNGTLGACTGAVMAWVNSEAPFAHRSEVSRIACGGSKPRPEVTQCLSEVWDWTSDATDDHRRIVAATACQGGPPSGTIAPCMDRRWKALESTLHNGNARRLQAARDCSTAATQGHLALLVPGTGAVAASPPEGRSSTRSEGRAADGTPAPASNEGASKLPQAGGAGGG